MGAPVGPAQGGERSWEEWGDGIGVDPDPDREGGLCGREWGIPFRVSPGVGIWRRGVGRRLGRAGGLPDWADQLA